MERKAHWETVYENKSPNEVSWTEEIPQTSLDFVHSFGDDKSASIIDIGGGDSRLVDCLLEEGYTNISVLDISEKALDRAKIRLGDLANSVNWIVSDITEFKPESTFDIWHDRAVFHFLTEQEDIESYLELVGQSVAKNMVIGTFSENGPLRCSALDISQYSMQELGERFREKFEVTRSMNVDHTTPFDTVQNFSFCGFVKR
ncbi:MAG: class I SAM-dependent methyltransferase [Crocinitomicaceae bacterium]|nr:class I SAM-dependent methyltransferase [Flavobacteriales bacterium]NQZ37938.1 class I SAM-dependent methyltransferase [Crocinitomicaceae bacterium]